MTGGAALDVVLSMYVFHLHLPPIISPEVVWHSDHLQFGLRFLGMFLTLFLYQFAFAPPKLEIDLIFNCDGKRSPIPSNHSRPILVPSHESSC